MVLALTLAIRDLILRIGPTELRMATASSDDNYWVAYLVKDRPKDFIPDLYARMISQIHDSTIIFKVTEALIKYFSFSPEDIWTIQVSFQRFLLYLSIIYFAISINQSRAKSFLTVIIFSSTQPYYWNLGFFGALDQQPYSMWLCLPFIIFAFSFFKRSKYTLGLLFIALAVIIHPTFGLAFGFFILVSFLFFKHIKRAIQLFSLLVFMGTSIFVLNNFWIKNQVPIPENIIDILYTNPHIEFFNFFATPYKALSLRAWLLVICLLFLWFQYSKALNDNFLKNSFYSSLVYLIFSGIVSHSCAEIEIVRCSAFVPFRLTSFFSTIGFTCMTLLCVLFFSQDRFFSKLSSILLIVLPAPSLILGFTLRNIRLHTIRNTQISIGNIVIFGSFLIPVLSYLFSGGIRIPSILSNLIESFLNPLNQGFSGFNVSALYTSSTSKFLFSCCMILLFLQYFCLRGFGARTIILVNTLSNAIVILSLCVFSTIGMQYSYQWSFNSNTLSHVEHFAEVQKWAKKNTQASDVFFIAESFPPNYSWRTLSERPVAHPNNVFSFYSYPDFVDKFNRDSDEFWRSAVNSGKVSFIGQWEEGAFCNSQHLHSVDYVVRNPSQGFLSFPIVFRNEDFIVYGVKC